MKSHHGMKDGSLPESTHHYKEKLHSGFRSAPDTHYMEENVFCSLNSYSYGKCGICDQNRKWFPYVTSLRYIDLFAYSVKQLLKPHNPSSDWCCLDWSNTDWCFLVTYSMTKWHAWIYLFIIYLLNLYPISLSHQGDSRWLRIKHKNNKDTLYWVCTSCVQKGTLWGLQWWEERREVQHLSFPEISGKVPLCWT